MDEDILKEFDKVIAQLTQAKDLYGVKRYEECVKEIGDARKAFRTLESDVESHLWKSRIVRARTGVHGDLTEEERSRLAKLNKNLADLERKVLRESRHLANQCEKRLRTGNDPFLKDYEMDAGIAFYIGENDPAFRDDQENIIAKASLVFNRGDMLYCAGLADGKNYNEFTIDAPDDGRGYHCYLFHWLYDDARPSLSMRDLLRIDVVWVDIVVQHQGRFTRE